ncbi:UDP-N-acetylmuramate dehydrogenase [Scatolibacter rhodanostii]|uniref:UDP-N-acetylmuramate dehydrogenase n=1 Tax=Scatolibacter rhodanostii TaxID=2014781 RepID=UPI001FA902C3|nr:UDP-N-acetylmuramate dehydrogenase [Scatolibacter rhodanostii]
MDFHLIDSTCKECGCDLLKNEPMQYHTTFKIGGPADRFITVYHEQQLKKILQAAKESDIPFFILGKGSNLLISDKGISGIVLHLDGDFKKMKWTSPTSIYIPAGASLAAASRFACEQELTGFEFAWGIPGSVGGALYMNAGAYGGEMAHIVTSVTYITPVGEILTASGDELQFAYRKSMFTGTNLIILGAELNLKHGISSEIQALMDDLMNRRKSKQPYDMPSAGSVFKRPEGHYASALIEESGLKGTACGDAMVSPKHAGFIVNNGEANCEDVLNLIELVKKTVWDKKQVHLECEVKVYGR